MVEERTEGKLLGHCGCPKHGSSDSLSLYEKEHNGKTIVDGHCWSECGFISFEELIDLGVVDDNAEVIVEFATKSSGKPFIMTQEIKRKVDDILNLEIRGWKERRIPAVVSEFYNVRTKFDDEGNVSHRYYPSTQDGELVGWHVRDDQVKQAKNRGEKVDKPPFFPIGKVKSDCELFGQSKFTKGGKYIVLASGEEDAQAIFTALNVEFVGKDASLKKYITPVVSTTVGEAALKQIKNNYDFITSYENVIVMYDNDKAGKEGAEKVAKTLKVGQAKIANYLRKDACEHSSRGEFNQIVNAFWQSEKYSPAGIVGSGSTLNALKERASFEKIPLPDFAEDLSKMFNGGIALGEITTIAAACVDSETEYLTRKGWVKISEFDGTDDIAVMNSDLQLWFEEPRGYIKEPCSEMYHFKTKYGIDQMVSSNHRIPHITTGGIFKVKTAKEIVENHEINTTGFRGNFIQVFSTKGGQGIPFTEGELRLQIAVNADGRIVKEGKDNYTQMRFVKKRKYDRLIEMCKKFNLRYSDRGLNNQDQYEVIVWPKSSNKSMSNWYNATYEQLEIIADEVLYWDGTVIHSNNYFSKNKNDVDFIQYVFSSLGYRSIVTKGTNVWECHVKSVKKGDSKRGVGMGISAGQSGKPKIDTVKPDDGMQYCFTTSTGFWLARRNGNIFMTGNSSVGKTTITNEWLYHFIFNSKYRVGVISLESDVGELTENLMSIHSNLKLANMCDEEKQKLYNTPEFESQHRTLTLTENGEDRYVILDHQGAVTDGELMNKIEHLVKVLDCKIIILDPLTLALSGKQNEGMDEFMSDLLRFVKRERIAHINVVHVRKNGSGVKANSTGGTIHEEDIKGSGSIFQVSMNNILLMRDKENEDPIVRNTTKVVVSKNRRCGNTGPAGFWYYDNNTARMQKGSSNPEDMVFDKQMDEFMSVGVFSQDSDGDNWEVIKT